MEILATYVVCKRNNTRVLGIRIISNNEITGEELNEEVATNCQEFMYDKLIN